MRSYCKKIGHLIHECRKKQFNNNNNVNAHKIMIKIPHGIREMIWKSQSAGQLEERPALTINYTPSPSTSYEETTIQSHQSNHSNLSPLKDQSPSC